jgi:hypothetical protein
LWIRTVLGPYEGTEKGRIRDPNPARDFRSLP